MAIFRAGKRMMRGDVAIGLFVVFEHRKINHPEWFPDSFEQIVGTAKLAMTDFDAQCADGIVHNLGAISTKENQIAILRTGALDHFGKRGIMQVFNNR